MDPGATQPPNGRPGGSTGRTGAIRREAETFQKRHPSSRPKWTQYRTEEQQHILDDAAITRRNLRSQAKRLGFKSTEAMLDAWLPNALEVFNTVDDNIAISMGKVLERIAIALEKMAESGTPVAANVVSDWKCPVHKTSVLRPAGVSRTSGKAYAAFVSCPVRNGDGSFCNERPGGAYVANATNVVSAPSVTQETLP